MSPALLCPKEKEAAAARDLQEEEDAAEESKLAKKTKKSNHPSKWSCRKCTFLNKATDSIWCCSRVCWCVCARMLAREMKRISVDLCACAHKLLSTEPIIERDPHPTVVHLHLTQ